MALLALIVFKCGVGFLSLFDPIIYAAPKMDRDILDAVIGLGKEKIKGVLRRRQVAVHTVRDHARSIVDMSRGAPGLHSRSDLMTGGAKPRGGCTHHGVVGHAEQGKPDGYAQHDQGRRHDRFFFHPFAPGGSGNMEVCVVVINTSIWMNDNQKITCN